MLLIGQRIHEGSSEHTGQSERASERLLACLHLFLVRDVSPRLTPLACLDRMTDTIRFTNCYVAQPNGTVEFADLYISPSTGRIVSGQGAFFGSRQSPARTLDLGGAILAPGLIDVQINGAFGVDFSELDDGGEEAYVAGLEKVARGLVASGVTSFVPTIITQKEDMYAKVRPRRARCVGPD